MFKFSKAESIEEKLLFLYGFLGTMPIIEIGGLTIFTWITLIIVPYLLIRYGIEFRFSKKIWVYIIFSGLIVVSSLLCICSDIPSFWKSIQYVKIIWQFCYMLILIIYARKTRYKNTIFYVKGVYYASLFHMIWGGLQLIVHILTNLSLNKVLFFDLLHIQSAEFVQMRAGGIALTGLCWNAGNIAPLLIVSFVFSSSLYIKIIVLVYSLICGSRTAMAGVVAVAFFEFFLNLTKKRIKKIDKAIVYGTVLGILVTLLLVFDNGIVDTILSRLSEMILSFSSEYLTTQSSSRLHLRYWNSIPKIISWNRLENNLFGYGIGCSGYPFAVLFNQYSDHAWNVECDFVDVLWSYGIIGFIVWYGWYLKNIIKGTMINKKYLLLFVGLLIEGIVYNVTFNWCHVMLLFIFLNISYGNDIFNERVSVNNRSLMKTF